MELPSGSSNKQTANTTHVLTSGKREQRNFTWKIDNFSQCLGISKYKKTLTIAEFPFTIGANFGFEMPFSWIIKWNSTDDFNDSNSILTKPIGIFLTARKPVVPSSHTESDPWLNLFVEFSLAFVLRNLQVLSRPGSSGVFNFSDGPDWGFRDLFCSKSPNSFMDSEGSITLNLKTTFLFDVDKVKPVFRHEGSVSESSNQYSLENKISNTFLENISSLLGDKETSDVTISVLQDNGIEVGKLFCHSAILSARSPVFRAMLSKREMVENKEGVVKMDDASLEVVEVFLTFLYTGRMKDKRKDETSDPIWVSLLPQLVYIADKYNVGDLINFCDINLHRCVNQDNAAAIYQVAQQHGLTKAVAKLDTDFSKNIHLLLKSIPKLV